MKKADREARKIPCARQPWNPTPSASLRAGSFRKVREKMGHTADPIAIVLAGNTLEHLSSMSYVEREEKREQFLKDAPVAWPHYQRTGVHAPPDEADAWLAK